MRYSAFLILFFLLSLESAALSEYAFIYQSTPPSSLSLLISAQSCDGFRNPQVTLASRLRDDKQYGEALALANGANRELAIASATAEMQRLFFGGAIFSFVVQYRVFSMLCYSHGSNALSLSVESAKSALQALDGDIEQLSLMADYSHSGLAGGMMRELDEINADVEERKTQGEGFGKLFVRYANESNALFDKLGRNAVASEIIAGVKRMTGNEKSLVQEIIKLDDQVKKAISSLEEEEIQARDDYAQKLRDVENKFSFLKSEGLVTISESAFVLVGSASGLYSEYSIGSFEDDLRIVDARVENAKALHTEANKVFSEKRSAYASRGIEKLNAANALLERALHSLDDVEERSAVLEDKLRARVLVEQRKTRDAADKTQNAYAAARARDALDKNIDSLASSLRSRGERISFYLREITLLQDIQSQALSLTPAEEERERLLAGVKTAEGEIEKAESDGVDVNFEKMRLRDLENAASVLGSDALSQARAVTLERDLKTVSEAILAAQTAEYASLLEGYFSRAEKIKQYLDVRTQAKIESIEGYFRFGKLDVQSASGQLKEIKLFLEDALAEIDLKTPELLKRVLDESAVVKEEIGVAGLGEPAEITVSVSLENPLDLSYAGQIALDLTLPKNLQISAKSGNIIFTGGKIYLHGITAEDKFYLKGTYSEVISALDRESSETVFASESGARKKLAISFTATKAAPVLIEKTFVPLAFAAVSSQASFEKSVVQANGETKVGVIVKAKEGRNSIEITYEPANAPFEIKRESLVESGNSVVFLYEIQNVFEDVERASISEVQDVPCEALSAKAQGNVKANAAIANKQMFITIEIGEFRKNEKKVVRFLIQCSDTPDVSPLVSFDYNQTTASFVNGSKEESTGEIAKAESECAVDCGPQARDLLAQAKAFHKSGFYAKAIELAKKAQEQAREFKAQSFKTNEEKRAIVLTYPNLKSEFQKTNEEFQNAFSVKQDEESMRKKNLQYQEGLALVKTGEKALSTLEKPFEKQGRSEPLKDYSQEFLEQYHQEAEESIAGLKEIVQSTRERARQELELANERQKQFGGSQTKLELESANADFQSGKVFTAWLAATELNRKLTGAPQAVEQRDYSVFLGVAGVIIIFALAFVFLKRGKKPFLEEM